MPAISLQPQAESLSRLQASLDQFRAALDAGGTDPDIGAGLTDAAYVYFGAVRRRFSSASQHDGTWADLAPSTIYGRVRRAGGRLPRGQRFSAAVAAAIPILYDTGRLYTSLVPGEAGFFESLDKGGITAGTAVPYAVFHQTGTALMPARPILTPPDAATVDRMASGLGGGILQAWLRATGTNNGG